MIKPNKYSNKIKIIRLIANSLSFPGFPSFPGLSYPVINNTDKRSIERSKSRSMFQDNNKARQRNKIFEFFLYQN